MRIEFYKGTECTTVRGVSDKVAEAILTILDEGDVVIEEGPEDNTIKAAIKCLVNKQIDGGSYGFESVDDEIVKWTDALKWVEDAEVR